MQSPELGTYSCVNGRNTPTGTSFEVNPKTETCFSPTYSPLLLDIHHTIRNTPTGASFEALPNIRISFSPTFSLNYIMIEAFYFDGQPSTRDPESSYRAYGTSLGTRRKQDWLLTDLLTDLLSFSPSFRITERSYIQQSSPTVRIQSSNRALPSE